MDQEQTAQEPVDLQEHADLKAAYEIQGRQVSEQQLLISRLERQNKELSSSQTDLAGKLAISDSNVTALQAERVRLQQRLTDSETANSVLRNSVDNLQKKYAAVGERLRSLLLEFHS